MAEVVFRRVGALAERLNLLQFLQTQLIDVFVECQGGLCPAEVSCDYNRTVQGLWRTPAYAFHVSFWMAFILNTEHEHEHRTSTIIVAGGRNF